MQIPSHGLFGRQTKHVQGCTTLRESTAAPHRLQFRSGMQKAERTGLFRGLHCHLFLRYRRLCFEAVGKNNRRGEMGTPPKCRSLLQAGNGLRRAFAQTMQSPAGRPPRCSPSPGLPSEGAGGDAGALGGAAAAVCGNGGGAGAGGPGLRGLARPGGVVQGLESGGEGPCGAGAVAPRCTGTARPRRCAALGLGWARQRLGGPIRARDRGGSPRSPARCRGPVPCPLSVHPPHLLLPSVHKLAARPQAPR